MMLSPHRRRGSYSSRGYVMYLGPLDATAGDTITINGVEVEVVENLDISVFVRRGRRRAYFSHAILRSADGGYVVEGWAALNDYQKGVLNHE